MFLRSILGPYIEGYWNCGILLERCLELEKEKKEDFPNGRSFQLHTQADNSGLDFLFRRNDVSSPVTRCDDRKGNKRIFISQ